MPASTRGFISSAAADPNPRVQAYVRSQRLGYEVSYLLVATLKNYLRDFTVGVEDGHGDTALLNLVVEIKGDHCEGKDKAYAIDAYWDARGQQFRGVRLLGIHRAQRMGLCNCRQISRG